MNAPSVENIIANLVAWLRNRHDEIMAVESTAIDLLNSGDPQAYNEKMHEKAKMLANLFDDAKPLLEGLPGELRFNIALALENFAGSARTSLQLESVFYMSALLYPDNHKKGDPDNLTLCIDSIEKNGANFTGGQEL